MVFLHHKDFIESISISRVELSKQLPIELVDMISKIAIDQRRKDILDLHRLYVDGINIIYSVDRMIYWSVPQYAYVVQQILSNPRFTIEKFVKCFNVRMPIISYLLGYITQYQYLELKWMRKSNIKDDYNVGQHRHRFLRVTTDDFDLFIIQIFKYFGYKSQNLSL